MGTAKATKAADKSQVCRKLVLALQKLYGKSVPKIELSVVETLLFATCLEDNPWAPAESGFRKLMAAYFDLNEIRVSSVSELEQTLAPLKDASWKGLRIRSILRYVFETTYSYDFEKLRRQTLEQSVKTLKKVNDISPFIRDFVLHEILGSHVVCLDNSMLTAARWLGLVPANADLFDASEFLKGGVKKSEVSEFCHLLRSLATDPKFVPRFADAPDIGLSVDDVQDRLLELQSPPKKKPAKPIPQPTISSPKVKAVAGKPAVSQPPEKSAKSKSAASEPVPAPKPAAAKKSQASVQKPSAVKKSPAVSKPAPTKVAAAKPVSKKAGSTAGHKTPHGKQVADRKAASATRKPSKK